MRIKILLIAAILIGFVTIQGCYNNFNCKAGQGAIVTEEINLDPFTGISFDVSGNVYLKPDSIQRVTVESHQNIIAGLETTIRDGIWNIRFKECFNYYDKFDVFISVPELTTVVLSGSGNILGDGPFESERMDVALLGSGNINLEVYGENVDTDISGSGNIILAGQSDQLTAFISGSGNISAFEMESRICDVTISGSGNCDVLVTESLDARISGSGSVRYRGNPPTVNSTITGSGSVIPVN